MKRRGFIQRTLLASAGLLAVPFVFDEALALAGPAGYVNLAEPMSHVRHGMFVDELSHHHALPDWFKIGVPQRMFRNGISSQQNDLISTSFSVHDERMAVHTIGEHRTLLTSTGSFDLADHDFELANDGGSALSFQTLAANDQVTVDQLSVVFLISGNVDVRHKSSMSAESVMKLSAGDHIITKSKSKLLILKPNL